MVARFLNPMIIELALLDERIARSEIQAGPFDVEGHAANEHPLWIKDVPNILARTGSGFICHDEDPALVISEKLVERRKRV